MSTPERPAFVVDEAQLMEVLERAQAQHFLGAHVPLADHVENGVCFGHIITGEPVATLVDLGSGGGVPALVIAATVPGVKIDLVERGRRRAAFLQEAIAELGLGSRLQVIVGDAETAARQPQLSEQIDVVTARSFGPPSVTAEAACRFLRIGGRLIVSEPPPEEIADAKGRHVAAPNLERWPLAALTATGLVPTKRVQLGTSNFQVLHRNGPIEPRLPRRAATSRKRPLFVAPFHSSGADDSDHDDSDHDDSDQADSARR